MEKSMEDKKLKRYRIGNGDECFMFYYSEEHCLHFKIEGSNFGTFEIAPDASSLQFFNRDFVRLLISLTPAAFSYIGINLFDMKVIHQPQTSPTQTSNSSQPVESGAAVPNEIGSSFVFERSEYWTLRGGESGVESHRELRGEATAPPASAAAATSANSYQ